MFGKILDTYDNYVILENNSKNIDTNYLNLHVVFSGDNRSIIGEIVSIDSQTIKILLVGEIIDNKYVHGVLRKPNLGVPRIIYKSELEYILGNQEIDGKLNFYLGKSLVYNNFNVVGRLDEFFSNHFAILGNTGSGKSCTVARIIQNIFNKNYSNSPQNAHIVLFDVYGEYNDAFNKINSVDGLGFKNFSSSNNNEGELINIPAYFLGVDDLALLLEINSVNQLPILEKTLKLVYIFKNTDENVSKYKDNILAECLIDILTSGRSSTQMRDQVIAVLTRYGTDTLNLETEIAQPGYTRTIRQCLNIDQQGKMNSLQFVIELLEKYSKVDLGSINCIVNFTYSLEDIYYAMEFALISEGILKSDKMYDEYNQIKVRLQQLINCDNRDIFSINEFISKGEFVRKLFSSDKNYQIINFNLNTLDDRFAKKITKIYSKLFFDFCTSLDNRGGYPIHIVLEEAHRYIQNDNDINVLGYNIFDRIAKEGRKYGVILGMITQRPSELSITAISQCSNFIVLRMFYPDDLNMIKSITSNINENIFDKIKVLTPGNALVFGTSFNMPLMVKIDLPEPMPKSTSVTISDKWF